MRMGHLEDEQHFWGTQGVQFFGSWGLADINYYTIHVNVWQNTLKYCKVISLQLIKINGKKKRKWINNKVLLYSTGNYIQYPVKNHKEKNTKKNVCVGVCITVSFHWIAEIWYNYVNQLYFNKINFKKEVHFGTYLVHIGILHIRV